MPSELGIVIRRSTPKIVRRAGRKVQQTLVGLWAKYQCPICDNRVTAFKHLPDFYIENFKKHGFPYALGDTETSNYLAYSCPFCSATDRDRLYALYLERQFGSLGTNGGLRIVNFAPSDALALFMQKQIAASTCPVFYRTADYLRSDVDDKVDITNMPGYSDGQFDFFICSHVLEHVTDDAKALQELHRILRPGGKGIVMVPIILSLNQTQEDPTVEDEAERWRRFGQNDHVRLYSKNDFIKRIEQAGFRTHQLGEEYFGEELFRRSGITRQSVLYVAEKGMADHNTAT